MSTQAGLLLALLTVVGTVDGGGDRGVEVDGVGERNTDVKYNFKGNKFKIKEMTSKMMKQRKLGDATQSLRKWIKRNQEEAQEQPGVSMKNSSKATSYIKVITHNTWGFEELSEHDTKTLVKSVS